MWESTAFKNTGALAIHLSCWCWWIAQPFFCSGAGSLGLDPDSEADTAFTLAALAWGQSMALWPLAPQYKHKLLATQCWCSWGVSFPFESSLPANFNFWGGVGLAGLMPDLVVSAGLLSVDWGCVRGHPQNLIPITKSDNSASAPATALYIPPHQRYIHYVKT